MLFLFSSSIASACYVYIDFFSDSVVLENQENETITDNSPLFKLRRACAVIFAIISLIFLASVL